MSRRDWTRTAWIFLFLLVLVLLAPQAGARASESTAATSPTRILVESVAFGDFDGRSLNDALVHAMANSILVIDLNRLRCPDSDFKVVLKETRAEHGEAVNLTALALNRCAQKRSFISVAKQLSDRGFVVDEVQIDKGGSPDSGRAGGAAYVLQIREEVTQARVVSDLAGHKVYFHLEIVYTIHDSKTGESREFRSSAKFMGGNMTDKAAIQKSKTAVAASLFNQEKKIVPEIVAWIEHATPRE